MKQAASLVLYHACGNLNSLPSCLKNKLIQVITDGSEDTGAAWVKLLCCTIQPVVNENITLFDVISSFDGLLNVIIVLVW